MISVKHQIMKGVLYDAICGTFKKWDWRVLEGVRKEPAAF